LVIRAGLSGTRLIASLVAGRSRRVIRTLRVAVGTVAVSALLIIVRNT
jgi:hypothetical protein